jgi:hypothetical protein
MGDRFDDLMAEHFASVRQAVSAGIARMQALSTVLTVDTTDDPRLYRMRRLSCEPPAGPAGISRFTGEPEFAYRFQHGTSVSLDRVRAPADLAEELEDFGRSIPAKRFSAIVELIRGSKGEVGVLTVDSATRLAEAQPGSWSFVGDGAWGRTVVAQGIVEHAVTAALPTGVKGLMIRRDQPPVVRHVVDDLSVTWSRDGGNVQVHVVGDFFLDATHVHWFRPA